MVQAVCSCTVTPKRSSPIPPPLPVLPTFHPSYIFTTVSIFLCIFRALQRFIIMDRKLSNNKLPVQFTPLGGREFWLFNGSPFMFCCVVVTVLKFFSSRIFQSLCNVISFFKIFLSLNRNSVITSFSSYNSCSLIFLVSFLGIGCHGCNMIFGVPRKCRLLWYFESDVLPRAAEIDGVLEGL